MEEAMGELLIVPYGIETNDNCLSITLFVELLIVPYGIETVRSVAISERRFFF